MAVFKRIVLVGHCGADTAMLTHAVRRAVAGVPIAVANDRRSLEGYANADSLLLVNRVLDGRFETGSGIDLIAELRGHPTPPAAMLISNYADAQAQAVEAGALPGFGKSQAYDAATAARLRDTVAAGTGAAELPSPASNERAR